MTIIVNGIEKNFSIKKWDETANQYDLDSSEDLLYPNVITGQTMTEKEYNDLIEWCNSEISTYNAGEYSDWLGSRYAEYECSLDDETIVKRVDNGEIFIFEED